MKSFKRCQEEIRQIPPCNIQMLKEYDKPIFQYKHLCTNILPFFVAFFDTFLASAKITESFFGNAEANKKSKEEERITLQNRSSGYRLHHNKNEINAQ